MLSWGVGAPSGLVVDSLEIDVVVQLLNQNVRQRALLGDKVLPEVGHGADLAHILAVDRLVGPNEQQGSLEKPFLGNMPFQLFGDLFQFVAEN